MEETQRRYKRKDEYVTHSIDQTERESHDEMLQLTVNFYGLLVFLNNFWRDDVQEKSVSPFQKQATTICISFSVQIELQSQNFVIRR